MPLSIVLAEDSAAIRESLIAALADVADAEVIAVAETAAEAIAALTAHADVWQLAILDLFLKQGHGLDVLRATVKTRPDQRIFLVTNFATPDIRRRALEGGADAVFDKSTEIEQLFEACEALSTGRGR
ncbi:MAG TPA: response regulator [Caldimonas sp.]|nr:response regulator [Caldimonas sp.]